MRDRLLAAGALQTTDDRDHRLTGYGQTIIAELDIDLDQLRSGRRIFARSCLDWTQRRPHLAGALPAAVTSTFLARGWLERSAGRADCVSFRATTRSSIDGSPPHDRQRQPSTNPTCRPAAGQHSDVDHYMCHKRNVQRTSSRQFEHGHCVPYADRQSVTSASGPRGCPGEPKSRRRRFGYRKSWSARPWESTCLRCIRAPQSSRTV